MPAAQAAGVLGQGAASAVVKNMPDKISTSKAAPNPPTE